MEDKESHKPNAVSQEAGQEVTGEEGYEPNTGVGSVHLLHLSQRGREGGVCMNHSGGQRTVSALSPCLPPLWEAAFIGPSGPSTSKNFPSSSSG